MENNENETPINNGDGMTGTAKNQRSIVLMEGVTSCRHLEKKGCMTIWEGRWKLLSISGFPGNYDACLVFSGCRSEIDTRVNVSPGAITLEFSELGKTCGIQRLEDIPGNMESLTQLVGDIDAVTVSYCLASFKRNSLWQKMLSIGGKVAKV